MKKLSLILQTIAIFWLSAGWSTAGVVFINSYQFVSISEGGGGDPYWNQVVLSLHGNGTDGSTTITDSSTIGSTITPSGNAQIDTDQSQWGGASIKLDGSGDWLTIPHNTAFNFGTGDFTIEFWARWNSKANFQAMYIHGNASGSLRIQTGDGTGLMRITVGGGIDTTEVGTQPVVNQWYFYQFIRTNGVMKIYRDGVQRASGTNSGSVGKTADILIGTTGGGGSPFNGWIDDFRVSNIARTPGIPAAAFPDTGP